MIVLQVKNYKGSRTEKQLLFLTCNQALLLKINLVKQQPTINLFMEKARIPCFTYLFIYYPTTAG